MKHDILPCDNFDPDLSDQELSFRLRQLEELNDQLEQEKANIRQKLESDIQLLREENSHLYAMIRLLKQQKFGRSSEKRSVSVLPMLPGIDKAWEESQRINKEFGSNQTAHQEEEQTEVKAHQRKKTGRKPLPKDLPREEIVHDLPESEKVCSCGCELRKIGEERSEQLEYVPAHFKVLEHIRYKYGCKACEEKIKLAPTPKQPIPKSMAAPGLLSYIMVAKFEDHLPLYRQSKIWKRHGVDLGRNTMSNWIINCADLLAPVVDLLKEEIIAHNYVQADETSVQVLKEPSRKATTKSYMWVYKTQGKKNTSIVYEYQPTRGGDGPSNFLKDFAGYLQTDAYQGYNCLTALTTIISVLCWAHARRKFVEIITMTKGKKGKAQEAVAMIAALYAVEKDAKLRKLSPEERKELRQLKSKPILDEFKKWLDNQVPRAPPQGPLGKALRYALNHWQGLTIYLEDGRLEIDNNLCENAIRPFALGRKNWLFNDTVRGVKAAAVIYSLIETCKANDVNTFEYLRHVLTEIPRLPQGSDLTHLLPWNYELAKAGQKKT